MGSALTKAFFSGSKPKVPNLETINFESEQAAAIGQNIKSLPALTRLGSKVDDWNTSELLKNLEKMLPGYSGLRDSITSTLQSQLKGEIPDDVSQQVQRLSAESARAGGYSGSEASRNLTARDLGLTSLDITNRALDTTSRWLQQARAGAPTFDVTSMFVTPAQRIGVKLHENQMKFQRDWMQNQIDALPEPWEAAVGEIFDSIEEVGQSVVSAYAGGAVGGMGGGGGAAGAGAAGGVNTSSKIGINYLGSGV